MQLMRGPRAASWCNYDKRIPTILITLESPVIKSLTVERPSTGPIKMLWHLALASDVGGGKEK